jgi:acetate---CoA ligase (ADP-forming)
MTDHVAADADGGAMRALLDPRSVALVGASNRPETLGRAMADMVRAGGFAGAAYGVNPRYDRVADLPCFESLAALPEPVEHVVLGVGNDRLEAALAEAIAHGARAATIFASCAPPGDGGALAARLAGMARAAGMALCGGNCMGFYNNQAGLRIAGYPHPGELRPGTVGMISQSGSVFGALAHNDPRLAFGAIVSSGAELVTTAADYLGWMAAQEHIRVVGLFLETVRDPAGFRRALETAAALDKPVVVLKVGRTARSAAMAVTHTGAVAGNDAAYTALFRRYGVIQVDDLDELAATLLLFQQSRRPGQGGLAAIHDSGGERELAVDLAERLEIPYATLGAATLRRVAEQIGPELEPANPLDAWSGSDGFEATFSGSLTALLDDPDAAMGMMFCDVRDGYYVSEGYARAAVTAWRATSKPVALVTNYAMAAHDRIARELTALGLPVIDGTTEGLKAARNMLAWRDRPACVQPVRAASAPPAGSGARALSEHEALLLLGRYGIGTPARRSVSSLQGVREAARELRFPMALKTAMPGIAHKTDAGGVMLGIGDQAALEAAYLDLAARLGAQALIMEMVPPGVEVALGSLRDPQWGPVVLIAAGGVSMELLKDQATVLAPTSPAEVERALRGMRLRRLLNGFRGSRPADIDALVRSIVAFGWLATDLAGTYPEIDVNPLIVGPEGCVAVDALMVPAKQ